jgi:Zn-finger nucleic acid-binding protein
VENQVEEFSVSVCSPCHGVFLAHAALVSILDRSWRAVPADEAEQAQFIAPAKTNYRSQRAQRRERAASHDFVRAGMAFQGLRDVNKQAVWTVLRLLVR